MKTIRISNLRIGALLSQVLVATAIVLAGWQLNGATYYVATNGDDTIGDGSSGNPWATMSHADASGLQPGDTVIVQAGTYLQSSSAGVVLNTSAGSAASPITYQADGQVVIEQQAAFAGGSYGIQVQVPGIVVSGFEVEGANFGIGVSYTRDVVISNNVVHDSVSPASDGDAGVYVLWATNTVVERNVVYNIHVAGEQPWLIGAALRVASGDNNYFFNNTIDDCFSGFHYYAADGTTFPHVTTYNNIVVNCNGWGFENPWSTDSTLMTNGYNLLYNDTITYGNYPAGNNGPVATDVTGDPSFVFEATRDYHLLSNSPAIDMGTDVGLPYSGAAPDIGAFEGAYPPSTNGTVTGTVTANLAGSPAVPNAVVQTLDGTISTTSDANGNYTLIVPAGNVTVVASGRGLSTQTNSASLPNGGSVAMNFSLNQTYVPVTYYVDNAAGNDANPGTQSQPWKTIDNGDRLDVLNPGDTVMVKAGTYPQASTNGVTLTNDYGYSFSPITYQAEGNVIIDQSSYSGASYGFNVAVAGNKLDGFEVTGAQHGIYLSPASSSCTVNGCVIHDANGVYQDAEGIFVDNSPNDTLTRNVIYNITDPSDNPWSPLGCGIRDSNGDNLRVENNTIDNAFIGIFYYGARLDQYGQDHGPWGHITALNNIVVNCPGWGFTSPGSQDSTLVTCGYNVVSNFVDYENFPGANAAPLPSDVKDLDPLFVDGAAHNYQLQSGSPAIDRGTYVGLAYMGLGPDIGAFESSYSNTPTVYYVDAATGNDGNPGTAAQPWQTIGNGDATGVLKPGDIVMVNAGTYAQASAGGVQLTNRSGTPFLPITYEAQGSVLIDQSSFGVGSYGFNVGVAGVVLKGFEIAGAQHGVYLAPGSGACTVDSCVIHDASAASVDAEGIFVNNSPNDTLQRNVIYNINDASDAAWSPVGCAIRVSGSDNLKVFNNTMDGCYLGIFYYGGGGLGAGPYGHITTYNNIIVNCTGWGAANPWNSTPQIFTNGYNLTYNDTTSYGNFPAGNNGPGPTDVAGDPLFVNEAAHDYTLQAGSPAIEAGINVGLPYAGNAPSIGALDSLFAVSQLQNQTVVLGDSITFTVSVVSSESYTLQWLYNGVAIPDATNSSYTLSPTSFCENGAIFSVTVSNSLGTTTSSGTVLTVIPPNPSLQISVIGSPQDSNRVAQLTLIGQAKQWYDIDVSTDLTSWSTLGTYYNSDGVIVINDLISTNAP